MTWNIRSRRKRVMALSCYGLLADCRKQLCTGRPQRGRHLQPIWLPCVGVHKPYWSGTEYLVPRVIP